MNIDRIKELYLEKDFNCAEATLMAVNEEYNLGLDDNSIKLLGAFGGGMGCGKVCGALAAGVAAIGRMKIEERAHATALLKEQLTEYVSMFEKENGSVDCVDVKARNFIEGQRCLKTVLDNAEMLDAFIKKIS